MQVAASCVKQCVHCFGYAPLRHTVENLAAHGVQHGCGTRCADIAFDPRFCTVIFRRLFGGGGRRKNRCKIEIQNKIGMAFGDFWDRGEAGGRGKRCEKTSAGKFILL